MKIDLNRIFKEIDGKNIREMVFDEDGDGKRKMDRNGNFLMKMGKSLTLKATCLNVLTNPPLERDERGNAKELKGEEKLKYADFAQRIYKANGLFDMTADEVVLLKKLMDRNYRSPLIYKQACEALDP